MYIVKNSKCLHDSTEPKNTKKQIHKRNLTLKIEVNRLFGKQKSKIEIFETIKRKEIQNSMHSVSQSYWIDENKNQKQKHKQIKSFQEQYYQKVRQLQLKGTKNNQFLSHQILSGQMQTKYKNKIKLSSIQLQTLDQRKSILRNNSKTPKSCQNNNSKQIKKNDTLLQISLPQSTKQVYQNRQVKFFKNNKFQNQNKQNMVNLKNIGNQSIKENIKQYEFNKCNTKKVLQLKRIKKIQNQKMINKLNNLSIISQSKIEQLHSEDHNASLQNFYSKDNKFQKQIKFSNSKDKSSPSKSSINLSIQKNQLHISLDQIIKHYIDHKNHQHIWNQSECFFSFQQFSSIFNHLACSTYIANSSRSKQYNANSSFLNYYISCLWENLGGNVFDGVVKYNLYKFFQIILQQNQVEEYYFKQVKLQQHLYNEKIMKNYINKSKLRLMDFNSDEITFLNNFYFPLRKLLNFNNFSNTKAHQKLSNQKQKQVVTVVSQFQQNQQKTINQTKTTNFYQIQQHPNLHNKAYLQAISPRKNQQQFLVIINQNNEKQEESNIFQYTEHNQFKLNEVESKEFASDFSPKLSSQQYEPFKSTMLTRQSESAQIKQFQIEGEQKNGVRPLLSVDVNLGQNHTQKLIVYQGQTPYQVSLELKQKFNIDEQVRQRFQKMLRNHLRSLLFKIQQVSEQLLQDSQQYLE